LLSVVRKAFPRLDLNIEEFNLERLAGGTGEGSQGIFRVSGTGSDQGALIDWSLILKILVPPGDLSVRAVYSQDGFAYWKREAFALSSGLLENLPHGLRAPFCYAVSEQSDGSLWLWMEAVRKPRDPFSVDQYTEVARLLGNWQAQYLVGKPLPQGDWLSPVTWNRDFVEENAATLDLLQRSLDKPWVRYAYPEDKLHELVWIWEERKVFYHILESLPQVLCHRDVFGRNLMRHHAHTILIDWAYVGIGALGEELTPLVQATYLWREAGTGAYRELEAGVLHGYIEGLRQAGWQGDAALVRRGYAASSALRYTIGSIRFGFPSLVGDNTLPDLDAKNSRGLREMFDFWTETMRQHLFPMAHAIYELGFS
jgi:hypothetical protein